VAQHESGKEIMADNFKIELRVSDPERAEFVLSGDFKLSAGLCSASEYMGSVGADVKFVTIRDGGIVSWDSSLLVFLTEVLAQCQERKIECDISELPVGAQRMVKLATAVPERSGAARQADRRGFVERLGDRAIDVYKSVINAIEFIGGATISVGRMLRGRAQYRSTDLWLIVEQCGPGALGIITTICVLVGAILAFVGAIQLQMFGAEVYVANLVGIGMVMEMGALMTGIILAGRTGAAFAAQIGTMQVNEEVDALETLGISPMDYLVLPRMLALIFMTPLLVVFADILGIIGGGIVCVFMLGISPGVYFSQTIEMMTLWQCVQGLIKGSTFGMIIAVSGCMRGMQCGRSASAVGDAATSAVVTSIVAMVVADAVLTLIFLLIG
jgi:phospholipid/cholesterol/gamma-HCH transport system permease protein